MKISVIIGVIHMLMGIIMKGTNAIYFSRWADLFTEVFTGVIILVGLFGWMDILIYAKWFTNLNIEDRTVINTIELYDKLNQDIEVN
jgi:V-type H+-transporting ATPase subunit a